jgi:glycosyltransferase involved in cell wall biosynthesis
MLVCDGGSEDETLDVLRAAPDTVRWASGPDRGQSHAINKALAMSRGDVIGWLNSDDAYFDPDAVSKAIEAFRRWPDVDVVYGHAALVNAGGEILHFMWVPPFNYRLLRFVNFIVQPSVFLRRSALGETIVDEAYEHSMDRELWLRLGRAHRFKRIDAVLAIDRHHPARKVYTRTDLAAADERRLVERHRVRPNRQTAQLRRLYRVGARLAGVRLVPLAFRPHAFDVHVAGLGRLLIRQVALPRRAMPSGIAAD